MDDFCCMLEAELRPTISRLSKEGSIFHWLDTMNSWATQLKLMRSLMSHFISMITGQSIAFSGQKKCWRGWSRPVNFINPGPRYFGPISPALLSCIYQQKRAISNHSLILVQLKHQYSSVKLNPTPNFYQEELGQIIIRQPIIVLNGIFPEPQKPPDLVGTWSSQPIMYQPMTCLVLKMIYYNLSLIHYRLATSSTYPWFLPQRIVGSVYETDNKE